MAGETQCKCGGALDSCCKMGEDERVVMSVVKLEEHVWVRESYLAYTALPPDSQLDEQ